PRRRPLRRRPVWIGAGSALVVAASIIAVSAASRGGGTEHGPGPTVVRTMEPGRVPVVPSMCGLITREQADSLVRTGVQGDPNQYSCTWDRPDKKMLTIRAEASHPYGTHSGPDVAHTAYAQQRTGDSEGSGPERGFAGDVPGVGDEAYAEDDR